MPGRVECFYEFNLLHNVGVVAKRVGAAAAHEGDDNIPSGPTGRGVKIVQRTHCSNAGDWILIYWQTYYLYLFLLEDCADQTLRSHWPTE